MLIAVFYQNLLLNVYQIFLGVLKLGDEVHGILVLGDIFIGHGADGYFILENGNES